jgi:hypothetical protein
MEKNEEINYNLIEPQIFSIPKKTELKDFDNYKVMNEPVKQSNNSTQSKQIIATTPYILSNTNINENSNTNKKNIKENSINQPDNVVKISGAIKQLFNDLNIKESVLKVFGTEKLILISILVVIRTWVKGKFPFLNQLLFKEKYSSLVIGYTFYTSSYYISQNNEADSILYK